MREVGVNLRVVEGCQCLPMTLVETGSPSCFLRGWRGALWEERRGPEGGRGWPNLPPEVEVEPRSPKALV